MRNFQKLAEGMDVSALLHAIMCQENLWNEFKVRTFHPKSAHRVVDDIVLRYNKFEPGDDFLDKVCGTLEVVDYPAWAKLPQALPFVFGLMQRVQGIHLGRVMISRVAPGISIPRHTDRIHQAEELFPSRVPPAVYYERYHIVLASAPGTVFQCGDEQVYMAPGEAWWFDNQIEHSVTNAAGVDRIHLICDIRTKHDEYRPRSVL